MEIDSDLPTCVQARLKSDTGEDTGGPLDLPLNITKDQLQLVCNALLQEVSKTTFKLYIPVFLLCLLHKIEFHRKTNHSCSL